MFRHPIRARPKNSQKKNGLQITDHFDLSTPHIHTDLYEIVRNRSR